MAYKIYVGNYPSTFVAEDVINLFQDYEGVKLVTFLKQKKKCYCFFHCVNERQLIDIIKDLNDIDVCGRNLIVRAADEKYHEEIKKMITKDYDVELHPKNICNQTDSTFVKGNTFSAHEEAKNFGYSVRDPSLCYSSPKDTTKQISKRNLVTSDNKKSHIYSSQSHVSNSFSRHNSHSTRICLDGFKGKGSSTCNPKLSKHNEEKPVPARNAEESFSSFSKSKTDTCVHYKTIGERFDSYNTNKKYYQSSIYHHASNLKGKYQACNRNTSECSEILDVQNMSLISVLNFPVRLPKRELYELFSDFNPVEILMVCNERRANNAPTEAIISFKSDKEATDAILTFDNTIFHGRTLLVVDIADQSLVSELLSFQGQDIGREG